MAGLLLIDVALCSALIIVAVLLVIRRWRRKSGQPPAPTSGRGAAAGPAGKAMAPPQMAIVPGFSDTMPPGPRAHVPVQPGQAAHPQSRPAAGPQPDQHEPGPPPNGQRATARAVTTGEQIASYYDQADKPMADYLTALGWNQQLPPHPRIARTGRAGQAASTTKRRPQKLRHDAVGSRHTPATDRQVWAG